jgi:hypothetical protein
MPVRATTFRAAVVCFSALIPACLHAEGIDTEHIFGFMIGADVGDVGEREFQSQTTGRFARNGGTYRTLGQELELELVPFRNFRIEVGADFAAHDISGVPGLEDRRQLALQGGTLDLRYKLLDRDSAPFGLTFGVESGFSRIDDTSAAAVRNFATQFTVALDRELIPNLIAAVNLSYQPEWTRFFATGAAEQESTIGAAFGLMAQLRPGILVGGEARYFRKYEGIGLEEFAGQAFYVGPTAYFQLSERSRVTATWSVQAWGRPTGSNAALDLVNFERHQARLVFGVNF